MYIYTHPSSHRQATTSTYHHHFSLSSMYPICSVAVYPSLVCRRRRRLILVRLSSVWITIQDFIGRHSFSAKERTLYMSMLAEAHQWAKNTTWSHILYKEKGKPEGAIVYLRIIDLRVWVELSCRTYHLKPIIQLGILISVLYISHRQWSIHY